MSGNNSMPDGGRISPPERLYKLDSILICLAQLLHRQCRAKEIATPLEVAQLAVELARLRGANDPTPLASEAAALLHECRKALGNPPPGVLTPEQVDAMFWEKLPQFCEERWVPYVQLVTPPGGTATTEPFVAATEDGKEVKFEPYSSDKAFVALLRDYAAGQYEKHRAALAGLLTSKPPATEDAAYLVREYANGESADDIAAIKRGFLSARHAEKFAAEWAAKAGGNFAKHLREEACAGTLDSGTVLALLNLRLAKNSARNRKAAENRRKPHREPKG